jgi:hypothetical protein
MLRSPAVWAIVANNFAFHYAFYVVMNWMPTYFSAVLKRDLSDLGPIKALPYLAMFLTSNAGGWAGDWLINRRGLSVATARKAVNTAGGVPRRAVEGGSRMPGLPLAHPGFLAAQIWLISNIWWPGFVGTCHDPLLGCSPSALGRLSLTHSSRPCQLSLFTPAYLSLHLIKTPHQILQACSPRRRRWW